MKSVLVKILLFSAILLSACNREDGGAAKAIAAFPDVPASVAKPKVTKAQWLSAIDATFSAVNRRADGEGVSTFLACFDKENAPNCKVRLSGKRDEFRKLQFFSAPLAEWNANAPSKSAIRAYIALADCKDPVIALSPVFRGRSKWLFLEKFAIMADDSVILERNFENHEVQRTQEYNELKEIATAVLIDSEVQAIRSLPRAQTVVIRLTGKNSYTTVDKKFALDFAQDLLRIIHGYDEFRRVNEKLGDLACAA